MRTAAGYAAVAAGVVGLVTVVLWPWLATEGRRGVLLGGGAALAVQLPAVWLLLRSPPERFIGPWAAGMGFRLLVVAAVTGAGASMEGVGLVAALLSLAGFLWALLMLEAVVLWRRRPPPAAPGSR